MPRKETQQPLNAAVERTWHIGQGQSRTDSSLGFQVKALKTCAVVPGSGQAHRVSQEGLAPRGGADATPREANPNLVWEHM